MTRVVLAVSLMFIEVTMYLSVFIICLFMPGYSACCGGLRGACGTLDWVTSLWFSLMWCSGTWGARVVVLAYIVLASCCGSYQYIDDLMRLDACRPTIPIELLLSMRAVHTPLLW